MATKRKSRKKLLIGIAVAILAIGGIVFAVVPKGKKPTEVTVEKAQKRDITSQVTASGTVKPKVEVTISSEVAGEIVEMPVDDGSIVKKGDLLVRIDTETLELKVAQQEAALDAAKAAAEKNKSQMERTNKVFADDEKLFESKFISEDTLNEARMNAEVNRAAYKSALADIQQQQKSLDEAQKSLSKAIIYSPMAGIVSSRSVELGDRVVGTGDYEGTEIMTVADYGVMNVEIDVNENDIVNVHTGDEASISIDAISDAAYTGKVVEIASSATATTDEETAVTFLVKIHIENADSRIRPGMTATADINTDHVSGVVSVPLQSVTVRDKQTVGKALGKKDIPPAPVIAARTESGKDRNKDPGKRTRAELENLQRVVFIFNSRDNTVKLREVKTGISDSRYMEIKDGISEGEEVVSGSYNAVARELQDGMKVTRSKDNKSVANDTETQQGGGPGPGGPH
jgi:HlyD family secretion protein